jgi:urease accessory protein
LETAKMKRTLTAFALLSCATLALAHTGHGSHGLFGDVAHLVSHLLELDHLLALAALGAWSALALPAVQRRLGLASWWLNASVRAWHAVGGVLGLAGLVLLLRA